MRIPRIYVPQQLSSGKVITVSGQTAHHVAGVLRLRPGATLRIFNGDGAEWSAVLLDCKRTQLRLEIEACIAPLSEASLNITLAQGIARADRMDFILQKSVELGVGRIQPLWMQRCQNRFKGERMGKRMRHWRKIITGACEQCGRSIIPALDSPEEYIPWINSQGTGSLQVMLQPDSTNALEELQPADGNLTILVGPEGGMNPDEQSLAIHSGFRGIRLGQRILRTETATLSALAAAHALWGDFSHRCRQEIPGARLNLRTE